MKPKSIFIWFAILAMLLSCLHAESNKSLKKKVTSNFELKDSILTKLCSAAIAQTHRHVTYDGSYRVLKYPGGDVPDSLGVCTDVLIRAYRNVGYDLQKLIHEDILRNYAVYNKRSRIEKVDASIDHRRTPNMQSFFTLHGKKLPNSKVAKDYLPGDLVFWDVSAGHVGIVVNVKSTEDTTRLMVVHNIGSGPQLQDYLFDATILGHYRYAPWKKQ